MADETLDEAPSSSLEELEAAAAKANADLEAARAEAATPKLTVEQATQALAVAEQQLADVEGPAVELEHAEIGLRQAEREAADNKTKPQAIADAYAAQVEPARARLTAAQALTQPTRNDVDIAAQAVLDARAALAKAEEA